MGSLRSPCSKLPFSQEEVEDKAVMCDKGRLTRSEQGAPVMRRALKFLHHNIQPSRPGMMAETTTENNSPDENPLRTLLVCVAGGSALFILFLLPIHLLVLLYAPTAFDPSVWDFYPILAGLGVVFGFERWLSYEQGSYNPFRG